MFKNILCGIILAIACLFNSTQALAVTSIRTCQDLQNMAGNIFGDYVLAGNIDCTDSKNWNGGAGFTPIGRAYPDTGFRGNLDGKGYKVKNLFIDTPNLSIGTAGLFNVIVAGTVKNITLENVSIKSTPNNAAGALVGSVVFDGTHPIVIDNVQVSGVVTGDIYTGGLVGEALGVSISNCSSSVVVSSGNGLSVGLGGLVGFLSGTIQNSSSSGEVIGNGTIGGLVGIMQGGSSFVVDSYSQANVTRTGPPDNSSYVGGLIGDAFNAGNISNTYAAGNIGIGTGMPVGGLIGKNLNTNVFTSGWDKITTGQSHSAGSPDSNGYTTAQLKDSPSIFNWNFQNTWLAPLNPQDYPVLRWQLEPAASLWHTFNQLTRQPELLSALLLPDQVAQRSLVNWLNLDFANSIGVNWADAMVLSRPQYWNDQILSVSDINWINLEVLSKSQLNWFDVLSFTKSAINWYSINPVVKSGVNWQDWGSLTKVGINWSDFSVLTRNDVKWSNLSIADKVGSNWLEWSVATRTSVNWTDIAKMSKTAINWSTVGTLVDNINWLGVQALSKKHVNWTFLSTLNSSGVNWSDPALLNTINITSDNLKALRTMGPVSYAPRVPPVKLYVYHGSLNAGDVNRVMWENIASPMPMDWIGLFATGAPDDNYAQWMYVSCSQTPTTAQVSGQCHFTMPASLSPGQYEFRLFANNGSTILATGSTFTIVPVTLSAAPSTFNAGGTSTVSWNNILFNSTDTDWIGLFAAGAADTAYSDWMYVSCSKKPNPFAVKEKGSCSFNIPSSLAPGQYEFRIFANNGSRKLATSAPITLTSPILKGEPASNSVKRGSSSIVYWSNIINPTPMDWLGLFKVGAADGDYSKWIYVSCSQNATVAKSAGSCAVTLPPDLTPGRYEFRLFANNGSTKLATGASLKVTP